MIIEIAVEVEPVKRLMRDYENITPIKLLKANSQNWWQKLIIIYEALVLWSRVVMAMIQKIDGWFVMSMANALFNDHPIECSCCVNSGCSTNGGWKFPKIAEEPEEEKPVWFE